MRFTKEEMVRWKRKALGLDAADAGCTVERVDGVDLDEVLALKLRQQYLRLLDEGDYRLLEPVDVAGMDGLKSDGIHEGMVTLSLPAGVRRVLSVKLREWSVAAKPLRGHEAAEALRAQGNPYTRATVSRPVALFGGDGRLMAGPVPPVFGDDTGVESLLCAYDFGPGLYVLDEAALGEM